MIARRYRPSSARSTGSIFMNANLLVLLILFAVISALVIRHLRKPGLAERLDNTWAELAREYGLDFDHQSSRITGTVDGVPIGVVRRMWKRPLKATRRNHRHHHRDTNRTPETGIIIELSDSFPPGLLLASRDDPESSPLHELRHADNALSDDWTIYFEPFGEAEQITFDDNAFIQLGEALSQGNHLTIEDGSLDIGVRRVERPRLLNKQVETALRTARLLNEAAMTISFEPPNTPLPLTIDIAPLDAAPESPRPTTVTVGAFFGDACPIDLEVMTRQGDHSAPQSSDTGFDEIFSINSVSGGRSPKSAMPPAVRERLVELATICEDVRLVEQHLVFLGDVTASEIDDLPAWFDDRMPAVEAIFREFNDGDVVFETAPQDIETSDHHW